MTRNAIPLPPGWTAPLAELVPGPPLPPLATHGRVQLASAFDVDRALTTSAALAQAAFGVTTVEAARIVATCAGGARVDGRPLPVWADLSGYYGTADGGTIQLHCNFPHHAEGVVAELGCDPTRDAVTAAVAERDADELETALIERGMIAARLRTLAEWADHPHAAATAALPVVTVERTGDGEPRPADRRLRVLDCSRVLAGPIAGQTFAAHGADVLRVGSRDLPSVELGVLTTGASKRNAFVELATDDGRATMQRLLDGADVWVDAYRPGALAGRGFDAVTDAPPGSVTVQLCAFDWTGPWAGRRGFDSIVQSTSGIVRAGSEAAGDDRPRPLPVQVLDYATGWLAAFAARRLVDHQAAVGGTWLARLSLLRTRDWLVGMGGPSPFDPAPVDVDPAAIERFDTDFGVVTTAGPVAGRWPHGPAPLGSSPPTWH